MTRRQHPHLGRRNLFLFIFLFTVFTLGLLSEANAESLFTVNTTDDIYGPFSGSLTGTPSTGSSSSLTWSSAGYGWGGSIGLTDGSGVIVGIITTASNDIYVLSTKGGGNPLIGQSCASNATVCVALTPGATQSLYNAVNSVNGGNGICCGGSDILLFSAADILTASGPVVLGSNLQGFNGGVQAAYDRVDTVLNLLDERMNGSGMSSGNNGTGRNGWGQFFGQTANQISGAGGAGFNARTAGFAIGTDTDRLIHNAVVGAAISYGNSFVSARNAENDQVTIDSYQVSLYGDYDLGNSNFLRGMAGFAYDTDGNTRHNVGGTPGLTAKGSYNTDEYTLELKAGHHYAFGKTMFTPGVMARYLGYDAGSYTETGAGLSNLTVSQKYLSLLEVGPTLEAAWNYHNRDGSHIVPSVHAGYRYDLIGDSIDTTAGSGGSFQSFGVKPSRSRFNLGAAATFYSTSAWDFKANYDMELRQDYIANAATLRSTYHF